MERLNSKEYMKIVVISKLGKNMEPALSDLTGDIFGERLGECLLFPSRDQRDWSRFERFWDKQKIEKFDPKTFQPFDKVLVKGANWFPTYFTYLEYSLSYPKMMCFDYVARKVIPYNEETKHLVGTTDDCPEYYKWWEK